jgi:flagellar basal body-associated protein FliL
VKIKLIAPILVVVLAAAAGGYWFMFMGSAPAKKAPKPHVEGDLFSLTPEFVVNLTDGHYGKVSAALLLKVPPTAAQLNPTAETPTLVQDPVIRATITDDLTGLTSSDLITRGRRTVVQKKILKDLQQKTDVEVTGFMFTDVVVQ